MKQDIYIDFSVIGMNEPLAIKGLTKQEVYDKVLSSYHWDLTIKNSNPEIDLFVMPELDKDNTPNYDEIVKFISLDPMQRIAVDCFTCIKGMDLSKKYGKPKRKE